MAAGQTPIAKTASFPVVIDYLIGTTPSSYVTIITLLSVINTVEEDYTFYLYKREISGNREFLFRKLELSAGDTYCCTTPLQFTTDVELRGYASSATVIYSIQGYQERI